MRSVIRYFTRLFPPDVDRGVSRIVNVKMNIRFVLIGEKPARAKNRVGDEKGTVNGIFQMRYLACGGEDINWSLQHGFEADIDSRNHHARDPTRKHLDLSLTFKKQVYVFTAKLPTHVCQEILS